MEDIQEEIQELLSLIRSKSKPSYIKEELENYHDSDIAEVICYLTEEERKKLYRILGKERVSNVFTYLENVEDYINEDVYIALKQLSPFTIEWVGQYDIVEY